MTLPDSVEIEPRFKLGEFLQVATQRPGHFPDNPKAGIAGIAGPASILLDLSKHVLRLEPLRKRVLQERETASAHLFIDVYALGRERIENAVFTIVDDPDTQLAAIKSGADVRGGDRCLPFAPVV